MAAGAVAAAAMVLVSGAAARGGDARRADSRRPLQRLEACGGPARQAQRRRFKLELGNDFLDSPVGRAGHQRGAIRSKELSGRRLIKLGDRH